MHKQISSIFCVLLVQSFEVNFYCVFHSLQEILLVLRGTTGLNMLQQAKEFNDVIATLLFWCLIHQICFYWILIMRDFLGFIPGCWNQRIHPNEIRRHLSGWLCGTGDFQSFIVTVTKSSPGSWINDNLTCWPESCLRWVLIDELGVPAKFVGVGEGVEDLQPFDAEAFVEAIFP